MKLSFYPRLAWEGIRKNKRLYLPYLLTCMGMVAIHYIILFLSEMPALDRMPGSGTVGSALGPMSMRSASSISRLSASIFSISSWGMVFAPFMFFFCYYTLFVAPVATVDT